ncbi:MAG: hypothetical protein AAGI88_15550 [Pseudomonadota bacterium]
MGLFRTLCFLVATVAALVSCRIETGTSKGGYIATLSSTYDCRSVFVCRDIEVRNQEFDETFIAISDPGYRFAGWRSRDHGLCGGSKDLCRLSTAEFDENDALRAFLESDESVFLFADFAPAENIPAGDGRGIDCFNPTLYLPGVSINRTTLTIENGVEYETTFSGVVAADAEFESGFGPVVRRGQVFEQNGLGTIEGEMRQVVRREFYRLAAPGRLLDFGSEQSALFRSVTSESAFRDPPRVDLRDLYPGQSYDQRYLEEISFAEDGILNRRKISVSETITFHGHEVVTLPSGSYEACRFSEMRESDDAITTSEKWYGVANGLLLQQISAGSVVKLVAASVDGVDMLGNGEAATDL